MLVNFNSYIFGVTFYRSGLLLCLVLASNNRADTWQPASGGEIGVTTSGTGTKVGIGLANTTASNFPTAAQKLTIGIASNGTENIFGQFAGPVSPVTTGSNKFRIGGGDGTGSTDWSGMEVLMNWTSATANTSQLGFYTGSGASSEQRMTILSNGNVGIGNSNPGSLLSVNGTVGITGAVTLSSALEFNADGTEGPGRLWKSSESGLVLEGITGTTYDFTILNPLAQPLLRNLRGTQTMVAPGILATNSDLVIDKATGTDRDLIWKSGGSPRWIARVTLAAETGANSGSDWVLGARADNGNWIDNPISIARAAGGAISLARPVYMSSTLDLTSTLRASGSASIGGSAKVSGSITSSSTTAFIQDGPANTARDALNLRTAGVNRWIIRNSAATEFGGGTNSGSTFQLIARADDGGLIDNVIEITRASGGKIYISRPMVIAGKVGIGNTPVAESGALSVKASQPWFTDYDNTMELIGSVVDHPTLRFKPNSSASSVWISAPSGGGMQFGVEGEATPQSPAGKTPIVITAGSNVALATNEGGQVIVGSLYPNSTAGVKLNVEGNARVSGSLIAQTIKTNNWGIEPPDYVFKKDYKLASLEQVDEFVQKHNHLPDVPSAEQIKAKGLDLAEMNLVLLKKVEELTLHAIRQEKAIKTQSEEIKMLKQRLPEL